LPTYLLTSSLSMRRHKLPSRLQLLSAARGGVGPDEIRDDELFEDGELENFMRTDDEIAEIRTIFGWEEGVEEEKPPLPPKPRKRAAKDVKPKPTTSSRLNPEAVASYFADEKSDYDFGELLQLDDVDDPSFLVVKEGNDTDAFIGLQRSLVGSFAREDDEDDGDLFSFFPSPEPDDRYAQEV